MDDRVHRLRLATPSGWAAQIGAGRRGAMAQVMDTANSTKLHQTSL